MVAHHHILGRSLAHLDDLPRKLERLAGHRMIEVHRHAVLADRLHDADQPVALIVAHRQLVAHLEQAVLDLALDHEHLLGQFDYGIRHHVAVCFGRLETKGETAARLQSLQLLFKSRQQEAGAVYEPQRALGRNRFDDFAVDFQLVAQSHKSLFSDFHICQNNKVSYS